MLFAVAAAAVGIAGIGLFSVLKFFNMSQGVIYAASFAFFFGIFFVAGQVIYPALYTKNGVQGIKSQNAEAASRGAQRTSAVVSSSRVGSSAAADGSSIIIKDRATANGSFVQAVSPVAVRSSRRATGTLKVVPLQSTLTHEKVRSTKPQNSPAAAAPKDVREQVLAGRGRIVGLLEISRKRIELLENKMINKLHRITSSGINNLVMAKRMISALERRVSDVDAALTVTDSEHLHNVQSILAQDLTLSDDALSSVVGAKTVPPIRFAMVESTLNDLIAKVAGRRELSGHAA